jgi:uncharacterized RDD family membrane protein YckC
MKCPKCAYLGFETGDRCKNCGYDFSLIASPPQPAASTDADLELHLPPRPPRQAPEGWLGELDKALPLFKRPTDTADDEPLIKMPVAPRPPLAVRKTPDLPRPRPVAKPRPRAEEPVLEFAGQPAPLLDLPLRDGPAEAGHYVDDEDGPAEVPPRVAAVGSAPGSAAARLMAAALDHAILFGIDAIVIYFTLRMAALPLEGWRLLPPAPLVAFLVLLKLAYFCAFTAVGGQTIGKMALGLRVVTDDNAPVDATCAVRRTLAGVASAATLGLGFLPALVAGDRRALHDRVARTRVVALRSA